LPTARKEILLPQKTFLRKLHSALSPLLESRKDNERAEEAFADVVEEIVKNTNVIIKSTGYNESTTFTGLIIDCLSGVRKALLLHNGDSLLYHYRVEKMIGEKITATNHCFVGRVDALYQVMLFDFYTDSRFLLVTDGIHDLLRNIEGNGNGKIEKMCFEVVTKNSIDMVPEMIMSSYDMNPEISDDLGLIAINPTCLSAGIKSSIII